MTIETLSWSGVRNLVDAAVEFDPFCNVISGRNAAGKTSILEAIHILARARSFRTARLDRVRSGGTAPLRIHGRIEDVRVHHELGVGRDGSGTRVRIDGTDARGLSELARLLPVQVINTESQRLLHDGPGARRSFLNWAAFHVEQDYHRSWRRFDRALKQRNAALRDGDARSVRSLEQELVASAERVDALRQGTIKRLKPVAAAYVGEWLPGVAVELRYRRGWSLEKSLSEALADQDESERAMGYTMAGPHRADIQVRVEGMDAQFRLSRGQQKVLVIGLLLAQAQVIGAANGPRPLLLIDDLPAELDAGHRETVVEAILSGHGQVFITAIEPEALPLAGGRLFHVEQGRLREMI